MTELHKALNDYLVLRRGMGFKLRQHAPRLREFVAFLVSKRSTKITTALALEWATQQQQHQPASWAARLGMIRGFAEYRRATDPKTEIPPADLLPFRPQRARPYIYTDREISSLLDAARGMSSRSSLLPFTYYCVFGLLAVTGVRKSEAINLLNSDVNWSESILTIRDAKFGKSRLIPLHRSTIKILKDYAKHRDRIFSPQPNSHFFVNHRGRRLAMSTLSVAFYALSRKIGLRSPSACRGPRLHDFRHRFATCTLLRWYRSGVDPMRKMQILSTYLGHAHVTNTYWYLTATPELMGAASKRLERRWEVQHATTR